MACPKIAVILINYRTAQLTLDCLCSLEPEVQEIPGTHVVLVDSASGDDSPDILEKEQAARGWKDWLSIVRLAENRGFSAGNNAGIALAEKRGHFDAFLLINSDTVVRRGALGVLGEVLEKQPAVGLVGPRLEWPNGDLQASCFRAISPASEFLAAAKTGPLSRLLADREVLLPESQLPSPGSSPLPEASCGAIEWISFACVLIRQEVIAAIGPMDEGFFMYFEDVDYSRRARQAGWQIAYAPAARVVHLRGGRRPESFAVEESQRRPDYYYRARARYLAKYYGRTGPCRANLCWLLGRVVSLIREILGNKRPHTASHEAIDIWKGTLCGFGRPQMSTSDGRNASGRLQRSPAVPAKSRRNP
jgi:N-acetylglucosaminyl-diphospho-decaprenol L-rhamnosyltransferase